MHHGSARNASSKLVASAVSGIKEQQLILRNDGKKISRPAQQEFSKNVLTRQKELNEALGRLHKGSDPISIKTYSNLLHKCGNLRAISEGRALHNHIIMNGLEQDVLLGTLIVGMYAKCGSLEDARKVFNEMGCIRNMVSWNTMIAAYSQAGQLKEAVQLVEQMQQRNLRPNRNTFITILKVCTQPAALCHGKFIHACIRESEYDYDVVLANAIINMYGKCGNLENMANVFERMNVQDVVTWTAAIAAYIQQEHRDKAIKLFRHLKLTRIKPNRITFATILTAFDSPCSLANGKLVHSGIITVAALGLDNSVQSALVDMYGRCGSLDDADVVFENMIEMNLAAWNAIIAAYVLHERAEDVFQLFRNLLLLGMEPDKVTFCSILSACGKFEYLTKGMFIHSCIIDREMIPDAMLGCSLIDMYGRCGSIEYAYLVFYDLPKCSVVTWIAIIIAYAENGHKRAALHLFQKLHQAGVMPDTITFDECAASEFLAEGIAIHSKVIKCGHDQDVAIVDALKTIYCKLWQSTAVIDKMCI